MQKIINFKNELIVRKENEFINCNLFISINYKLFSNKKFHIKIFFSSNYNNINKHI